MKDLAADLNDHENQFQAEVNRLMLKNKYEETLDKFEELKGTIIRLNEDNDNQKTKLHDLRY